MKHLLDNPMMAGALGLMFSGAIMYLLRAIPQKIIMALFERFSSTIMIQSNSPAFNWAEEWLLTKSFSKRARHLKVSQLSGDTDSHLAMVPGYGLHVFFEHRRLTWISRMTEQKTVSLSSRGSEELIRISTLELGRKNADRIFTEIKNIAESKGSVPLFTCSQWGYWSLLFKKDARSMNTIFMPSEDRKRVLEHISWYLNNKKWYTDHGTPYRTGILLYGPPGTGKSSLVHALASIFDLSVYLLNPVELESEAALRSAMASMRKGSILLIEDADSAIVSRPVAVETKSVTATTADRVVPEPAPVRKGPTLSGVLNALDGIAAAEGRILVMTTNHIERLDPALIRDGRIDLRIHLGPLSKDEVLDMAEAFLPSGLIDAQVSSEIERKERTGAEWQTYFANLAKPPHLKLVEPNNRKKAQGE